MSEIGQQAVWSVTSAKPGNGVELLRDNKEDTYWQSDGAQPHLVNIQFQRKVLITIVALHLMRTKMTVMMCELLIKMHS